MARIVVCGYMIRHPVAGNLLAYFQYVLGLHRLGHEVVYLEESGWPYSSYDPNTGNWHDHPHAGLRIVRSLFAEHDVDVPVWFVNRETGAIEGTDRHRFETALESADLLLNVGGVCWLPEFALCRRRALIDLDPFFSQVALFGSKILNDYHVHFSYGLNIGRPGCRIPTAGVDWVPAVPPVVPDLWHHELPPANGRFTTIANWRAYGAVTYDGEHYGQKDEEFLRLIDLPSRTSQPLELAISGAGDEVFARLRSAGWSVRDAGVEVSADLPRYRAYIQASRGELSAAKHAYVKTRSGWLSDRSVCYLAAGRPVIVQDTGIGEWLPVGEGVLTFSTVEEAAEAIARVNGDYAANCRAARSLAATVFAHDVVLPKLLDTALGETIGEGVNSRTECLR